MTLSVHCSSVGSLQFTHHLYQYHCLSYRHPYNSHGIYFISKEVNPLVNHALFVHNDNLSSDIETNLRIFSTTIRTTTMKRRGSDKGIKSCRSGGILSMAGISNMRYNGNLRPINIDADQKTNYF